MNLKFSINYHLLFNNHLDNKTRFIIIRLQNVKYKILILLLSKPLLKLNSVPNYFTYFNQRFNNYDLKTSRYQFKSKVTK